MVENEETVARLYEKYRAIFSKMPLWKKLIKDEYLHAQILRKLLSHADFKGLSIKNDVFSEDEIKKTIRRIKKLSDHVQEQTLAEALDESYKIEASMLEANYFRVFFSDEADFNNVFSYLEKSTIEHSQKIFQELEKLTKN